MEVLPPTQIASASTPALTARRAEIHGLILAIQRDVEMKAGLHMGVAIHDDRSKLTELYMEARQIDRELLRRWQAGDTAARADAVQAEL